LISAFEIPPSLFTIDVEDYYHICNVSGAPELSAWDALPGRIEQNFPRLMDIFDSCDVKVTCFFLGYIARRYPHLVKEAVHRGHEVAAHGMYHRLAFDMTATEFLQDITQCKDLLQDITSSEVKGFRSPSFSVTDKTPWFFELLAEAGYSYDSSVFPAHRGDGGIRTDKLDPYWIHTPKGNVYEFPISVVAIAGKNMCFFGGGYLRMFPGRVIHFMAQRLWKNGRSVLYYVHPREIDPSHPRLKMNVVRYFKSYVNLGTVEMKLKRLLQKGTFQTCGEYLSQHQETKV
jgi:polysaccharide deacetylase family protein (PEP-CTERM system associated)